MASEPNSHISPRHTGMPCREHSFFPLYSQDTSLILTTTAAAAAAAATTTATTTTTVISKKWIMFFSPFFQTLEEILFV